MIRIAWEEKLPYPLLAVIVLAIFYGIYFAKLLAQKKRGIQARQIGRRKERSVHTVEMWMAAATGGIVPVQLASICFGWSHLPANARFTGFLIGLIGDGVFLTAALAMKEQWRAGIPESGETRLVTRGIYAVSRNPAFLGFDFMYIGVFLMYANVLTGIMTAFAAIMLHLQILQEEAYLSAAVGAPYLRYRAQVFRYLGRKCPAGTDK